MFYLSTTRGPRVSPAFVLFCFLSGILKTFPEMDASWHQSSIISCWDILVHGMVCDGRTVRSAGMQLLPCLSLACALGCCGGGKWRRVLCRWGEPGPIDSVVLIKCKRKINSFSYIKNLWRYFKESVFLIWGYRTVSRHGFLYFGR